jgi:8-oxo-dGTP pyrophosphatase MutT (NUDIX family)
MRSGREWPERVDFGFALRRRTDIARSERQSPVRHTERMHLDEATRRLRTLPDPLPPGPAALTPVILSGPPRQSIPLGELRSIPAAVLVLLVPGFAAGPERGADDARVILTERVVGGRYHSGEVSFPGGRAEPEDVSVVATALREAAEEVGLNPEQAGVEVIATLDPVWIPVSNFRLTPVVAVAARRPVLTPQPSEVSRIVEAPLDAFLPGAEIRRVEAEIGERRLRYGAYPIEDLLVWGATARVLGQLGAILGGRTGHTRPAGQSDR